MPRTSPLTWGATTCTSAPQLRRPATLRAATAPPPTTRQRRPSTTRFTGYCGPATGTDALRSRWASKGDGLAVGTRRLLLVEAQDLEFDRQVDLAQRHVARHREHRRSEVEDRSHASR